MTDEGRRVCVCGRVCVCALQPKVRGRENGFRRFAKTKNVTVLIDECHR